MLEILALQPASCYLPPYTLTECLQILLNYCTPSDCTELHHIWEEQNKEHLCRVTELLGPGAADSCRKYRIYWWYKPRARWVWRSAAQTPTAIQLLFSLAIPWLVAVLMARLHSEMRTFSPQAPIFKRWWMLQRHFHVFLVLKAQAWLAITTNFRERDNMCHAWHVHPALECHLDYVQPYLDYAPSWDFFPH